MQPFSNNGRKANFKNSNFPFFSAKQQKLGKYKRSAYIHDRILQAGGRFAGVLAGETFKFACGIAQQFTTCGSALQVFFCGKILIYYINGPIYIIFTSIRQ